MIEADAGYSEVVPCCLQAAGASRLQRLDDACDERRREQRRRTAALTVKLRDWQREALAKWREADRGVVAVVTGGGKTSVRTRVHS